MPKSTRPHKVKVAVVGLGFMGIAHLRAYQRIPAARIVAVCGAGRLPKDGLLPGISGNISAPDTLRLGNNVRVYRDFEILLADREVEVVDLCVPTLLHAPQAIAALRAGKHVICEKPLARTSVLARQIVRAAQNAKGYFMPAMCLRFWPEWVWLREAVRKRTFGKLLAIRFRRVGEAPSWSRETYLNGAASGGALLDLHIHDADLVQWLFGRPTAVFASGLSRVSGAIDHVVAQYRVRARVTVSAEASWLMTKGHGFSMAYTANFERATADCDSARGADALHLFEEGRAPRLIRGRGGDGYHQELSYFIDCVRSGRRPSVVTVEDGLSAVRICEAAARSVKLGRIVAIR